MRRVRLVDLVSIAIDLQYCFVYAGGAMWAPYCFVALHRLLSMVLHTETAFCTCSIYAAARQGRHLGRTHHDPAVTDSELMRSHTAP